MLSLYDVSKVLKTHALLIQKHADKAYVCKCRPENSEPCEACDLHNMFNDLRWIVNELPR